MSAPALNLLRYPQSASPMRWTGAVWALVGALCACGWGLWQQAQLAQVQQQRQQLEQQLQAQATARALAASQAQHGRVQEAERWRAAQWQVQRERLQSVHAQLALAQRELGLRLQRWQGDAKQLQLQAWLPGVQALPELQSRLSGAWPTAWTLESLAGAADGGVQLVLTAPLAQAPASGAAATPAGRP